MLVDRIMSCLKNSKISFVLLDTKVETVVMGKRNVYSIQVDKPLEQVIKSLKKIVNDDVTFCNLNPVLVYEGVSLVNLRKNRGLVEYFPTLERVLIYN
jgi:hypothetical protein